MLRLHRKFTHPLVLLSLSLIASNARAQGTALPATGGFALDRYNPSERGSEWFASDSLDLRGSFRPAIGLTFDLAYKPLEIHSSGGDERTVLVNTQLFSHLGASVVLLDRIRLGLNAPIAIQQSGSTGSAEGFTVTPPSGASFGDLRLGADVRLFGVHGDPFTVALGAQVFLPTGKPAQYTGDGAIRALPRLSFAGDAGIFTYAANLGVLYRSQLTDFAGAVTGPEFTGSVAAGLRLVDGNLVIGPEAFGGALLGSTGKLSKPPPVELLASAHYTIGGFRIGAGFGPGLTRGIGTPALRGLASLEYVGSVDSDRDGDGIVDAKDACVTVPGVASEDPAKNGCPADRDGDGILDAKDACPDVPGVADDDPKKNGCPADRDGDGILDVRDACPDVPGVASEDPKKNGCPADRDGDGILDAKDACPDVPGVPSEDPKKHGCPADRDGDGIADAKDACPDVPGVASEDPKKNGCPADRDGDGVLDVNDKCPDVPGLKEAPASLSPARKSEWEKKFIGCPDDIDNDKIANLDDACPRVPGLPNKDATKHGCPGGIVVVNGCELKLLNRIYFKTSRHELESVGGKAKETQGVLQAVLAIMKDHPSITRIEVQGHASQDAYADNQALSERRAATVVKWLTEQGVDAGRLVPKGYGTTVPVPGIPVNPANKELHQRVEFHILEADGKKCEDAAVK